MKKLLMFLAISVACVAQANPTFTGTVLVNPPGTSGSYHTGTFNADTGVQIGSSFGTAGAGYMSTGSGTSIVLPPVIDASLRPGADNAAKVTDCITNALPAGGGTCSLANLTGAIGSFTVSKANVRIQGGAQTLTLPAGTTITVSASHVEFLGINRATVLDASAGTSTNNIFTITSDHFHMQGMRIIGNRIAQGDTTNGNDCIHATTASDMVIEYNDFVNCGGFGVFVDTSNRTSTRFNYIAQTSNTAYQLNSSTVGPFYDNSFLYNFVYDSQTGNTANSPGWGMVNIISTGGQDSLRETHIRGNVVRNDIVGGDGTGLTSVCNASKTTTATGCGQGIQITSKPTKWDVLDNFVMNTDHEGIALGGSGGMAEGNRVALANVNAAGSVSSNGAGGILYFVIGGTAANHDTLITGNYIRDSGYCNGIILGASVTTNDAVLSNYNFSNNICTADNLTLNTGIRFKNNTGTGCAGVACTWTLTNVKIANNIINGPTSAQELSFDTTGAPTGIWQLSGNLLTLSNTTCDLAHSGHVSYVPGGTGVKDNYRVCAKDATNAYALRTIF